jgi:Protein of unknown function (DUF2563)
MFVDTGKLHSGAAQSYRASEHAQNGANHLAAVAPVAGMFGSFAEAEAFHDDVTSAHAHHVKTLQSHQQNLDDVGAKTHHVAHSFAATEENNTKVLRDVL